ncbi:enoyl-CoA hydratase/isomerase family protein [Aurantiacibacter rhizosphaerae]|uniref:Crotonase n=1 Tax=Aurantiacibacter rhizosphaerae TaxID=2691582 RepID=A0A844XHS9_9SPHN|nr:enoyl-CoA hydratase-related protein [Aurantiacibacter rhizosphaerae]MWV29289.1 crotonase [Aurantiacibacter rhizosphaerae]
MTVQPAEGTLTELVNGVLTISLNRPDHGNSIPANTVPDVVRMIRSAGQSPEVRCVVLQGVGKHFCTGGDLRAYSQELADGPEALQRSFKQRLDNVSDLIMALVALDRPVIARCRGVVAGAGLMFALTSDWVIADDSATFMFAHRRAGLSPDGGVSYFLPRIVGERTAAQLILGGQLVKADRAKELGLVTELVAADALDETVFRLAGELAGAPQLAMRTAKRLIYSSSADNLQAHLAAETQGIVEAVGHPDFAEGVTAFLEKRRPDFS